MQIHLVGSDKQRITCLFFLWISFVFLQRDVWMYNIIKIIIIANEKYKKQFKIFLSKQKQHRYLNLYPVFDNGYKKVESAWAKNKNKNNQKLLQSLNLYMFPSKKKSQRNSEKKN